MSKQKPQGEKIPDTNPFAGLSHEQLKETAMQQGKVIQFQENELNNVLQLLVTLSKLNIEWGKSMILAADRFFNMLSPTIREKIPRDLFPGELPEGFKGPLSQEEAKQKLEEMKQAQIAEMNKDKT